MKKFKVYKYTSPSGKVYIGQTCQTLNSRASQGEGQRESPRFYNAIKKYGFENFTVEILADNLTKEEADRLEVFYISFFNSINPEYGYNLSSGGSSPIPSEETREKMRQKRLGRKSSKETKQKISKALTGIKRSEETKEKLRKIAKERCKNPENNPMYGKHLSEEAKVKLSKANGLPVRCVETGEVYPSARAASAALGLKSNHINEHINNPKRYKTIGGYHWERISKEEQEEIINDKFACT